MQERIEAQDDEEDDEYNSWARWEEGDDDAITLQPEGNLMERPEEPEEETIYSIFIMTYYDHLDIFIYHLYSYCTMCLCVPYFIYHITIYVHMQ